MKTRTTKTVLFVAALMLSALVANDSFAIRRGGGGGGRSAGHRAPSAGRSMNRGPAMSRPSGGNSFNRGGGMSRPSMPSRPSASRPSVSRPSVSRPNVNRPSTSRPSISRPSTNRPSVSRPSTSMPSFSRPGSGSSRPSISRPGSGSGRPNISGANNGIANRVGKPDGITRPRPSGGASSSQLNDFLGNQQSLGDRFPGSGNGNRPSLGDRFPGNGDRPKLDGVKSKVGDVDRSKIGEKMRDIDRSQIGDKIKDIDRSKIGDKIGDIGSGNIDVGNINVGNSVDFRKDSKAWINNRHDVGNGIRINTGDRYVNSYRNGRYRRGIVGGYPYYGAWGGYGSWYGWRAPTRVAFGAFLGAAWTTATPVYYGYGDGGNVYYENNTVYVDGQASGTPQAYAQEAIDFVAAAPQPAAVPEPAAAPVAAAEAGDAGDWLPLGVFAFSREDVDDSQAMIELAVNKQGIIAGTYYNEATDVSRPLKGTIDQDSQRAAFGFADGKNEDIVLETGMYNLTQEEAPGLLHLGTKESNPVLLVRLDAPEK